jgi:hypothetical protein
VSLTSDLATNLAGRLTRTTDVAAQFVAPLTAALSNLDSVFSQFDSSSGLNRLASLLIPGAAGAPTPADISGRMASCLPYESRLLPGFFGSDQAQRDALAKWNQLTQFPSAPPLRNVGGLSPNAVSDALLKLFNGLDPTGATVAFHDSLSQVTAEMLQVFQAPPPGGRWAAKRAIDLLTGQAKKWSDNMTSVGGLPTNLTAFQKDLKDEVLFSLPIRLAVAAVFSAGGHLLIGEKELAQDVTQLVRGTPSNKSLGQDIHAYYQKRYRTLRLTDLIEQDDFVYGTPIRSTSGIRLATAASNYAATYGELLIMYAARQSLQPIDRALQGAPAVAQMLNWSIRDDNTNFTDARIFEIKPVRSAFTGVIQEFYYRNAFNLMAAANKDFDSASAPALAALATALGVSLSGRPVVQCERLYPGFPVNWPELMTSSGSCRPFPFQGRTYAVMATLIDSLPGVVMYWIFDFPISGLILIFNDLRNFLNKSGKQIADAAVEVIVWVTGIALGVAAVALLLAIILGGEIEIPAILPQLTPLLSPLGPQLSPVLNGLSAFQSNLLGVSKQWMINPSVDAGAGLVSLALVPQQQISPVDVPLTNVTVGFLRVEGIPVDAGQYLGAVIEAGLAIGLGAGNSSTGQV